MQAARYGWQPDLPDHRDLVLPSAAGTNWFCGLFQRKKPTVDLRPKCPPVYDQGRLGSCTANAVGALFQFVQGKEPPSRLFIYYNEREMEGTALYDSGAYLRDGMKVLNKLGTCHEASWPYEISKFAQKPPQETYIEALKNQSIKYMRVPRLLSAMQQCLADGFPFVFGFSVYESFESAAVAMSGNVPMPGKNERLLGGHAVMAVGYDAPSKRFLVRNSWGAHWGIGGYFWMPFDYLLSTNLSDDFWTLRSTETGE